jgi:hypothetical protein
LNKKIEKEELDRFLNTWRTGAEWSGTGADTGGGQWVQLPPPPEQSKMILLYFDQFQYVF